MEIEKLNSFLHVNEEIPQISSFVFAKVGPFSIANTTTTIFLITLLFIVISFFVHRFKLKPSRVQHVFEMLYETIENFVAQLVGSKERGQAVTPYVGAIMVYLLIANLLPMFPFISSFYIHTPSGEEFPLFRGATTDFNTTFGLSLAIVIFMQFFGVKEQGFFNYISHFLQFKHVYRGFKKGMGEGFISIIGFFVGLIEIVSELAKIISLSLRLFGNMFAHEVLTIILLSAFAYFVPALWMGMGVLVGVVQAIVFASLVGVYYSMATKKEEH